MDRGLSKQLFERARECIPGGVNSPVRAFKAVGGVPLFMERGKGAKIYEVTGKSYIDYCMSWGALILGHSHPEVIERVKEAINKGTSFGAPTEIEIKLIEEIRRAFPSMEMVRLVNSGTEACMSAIRLARGYTRRTKVIKFAGAYHGHADYLLVQAGSGATTLARPDSAGVPADFARHTFVLPYNNLDMVRKTVEKHYRTIACIIVEPVSGNMGVIKAKEEFLKGLREICHRYGIVLIFDEVITGFRMAYGGAQEIYGVKPDLTCLGKIIGGGFPIGAFGGKREIMENLAPLGAVYQAGTLSGNPVSVTAGLATLQILSRKKVYALLKNRAERLVQGLRGHIEKLKIDALVNQVGSMFTVFFTREKEVYDYETALRANTKYYARFFHEMLAEGVYFPPSQFEASFVSLAHEEEDIEKTIGVSLVALKRLKN
ncbi:MAG: glutamate-1-semialdehyde 2,1-aminomutase [Caldiserica bacterium]|nr:glutamate-1-semialdehyde 2,1-aminomutase [Caldisericota bacterium]